VQADQNVQEIEGIDVEGLSKVFIRAICCGSASGAI
jgi:hypothetical protein